MPRFLPNNNNQTQITPPNKTTQESNPTHTWVTVLSNNAPIFNSNILFDIKDNFLIHEIIINYNLGPISGYTGVATNAPRLVPSFLFSTKSEILCNGVNIDTFFSTQNFVNNQIFYDDQDRAFINLAAGSYSNTLSRYTLGQTTSNYYAPLYCFVNQIGYMGLNSAHGLQIKLTLDSLTNLIEKSTLTAVLPAVTINSVSLLLRVSKITPSFVAQRLEKLRIQPLMATFNSTVSQTNAIASGVLQSTILLSSFSNSNIQHFYFVFRPISTALTGDALFQFSNIVNNFYIIDCAGANIINTPIPGSMDLLLINRASTLGTFTTETKGSMYAWYFTLDAVKTAESGQVNGSRFFNGNEALVINYTVSTLFNYQIDIYGSATAILNMNVNECKKLAFV